MWPQWPVSFVRCHACSVRCRVTLLAASAIRWRKEFTQGHMKSRNSKTSWNSTFSTFFLKIHSCSWKLGFTRVCISLSKFPLFFKKYITAVCLPRQRGYIIYIFFFTDWSYTHLSFRWQRHIFVLENLPIGIIGGLIFFIVLINRVSQ